MRTLNYVVAFVLAFVLSVVSFGCGDSDSPTAPSPSTTMAEAPSYAPVNAVRATPASFDADRLQPETGHTGGFNAYDFDASYDGSMLTLTLIEDQMTAMREASKPHRNRRITVGVCPSEPHHMLQACGDPIWQGSMRLAGRLELAPIPLASCDGWIVVNAAELSDDIYDGWRNAPCPATDGEPVGSDGTGEEWPDYPEPEREETEPEPTPMPQPEPEPMPEAPVHAHSLPLTLQDPEGDIVLCCNEQVELYSGPRPAVDLTSVTLSDQDANGWITVTFTLASTFDLDAVVASETGLPETLRVSN